MIVLIKDKEITQPSKIAQKCDIQVVSLIFGHSIVFRVRLFESVDEMHFNVVKEDMVVVEGEEYLNWGNDDEYMQNLIFERMGLAKRPPEPPAPEPALEEVLIA